jgi:hypothetical protein
LSRFLADGQGAGACGGVRRVLELVSMKRALRVGLFGFALVGCAGAQEPGDAGATCYRDGDCKAGLVCVANSAGDRVCSDDVSGLVGSVEGPPPPEDAGAEVDDAAPPADPYDGGDADAG